MAFPSVVATTNYDSGTTAATTWTAFTGHAVSVGDLLVVIVSSDGTPTLSAAGWTLLGKVNGPGTNASAIFWKLAASSTESFTLTSSASELFTAILYRISGADSIDGVSRTSDLNNTPPPLSTGVARDYLWIVTSHYFTGANVVTDAPAGYSGLSSRAGASGDSNSSIVAAAHKTANAASETPAAFTPPGNFANWTLAVWDSGAGGGAEDNLTASSLTSGTPTLGTPTLASSGGGGTVSSVEYGSSANSSANASTYTFSGLTFGAASETRYIAAAVAWRSAGNTNDISSVTIGGVTATLVGKARNIGGTNGVSGAHIYIAAVPTGTTGTVVVSLSETAVRAGVSVYALDGLDGATASATAIDDTGTSALSATINPPADAHAIGILFHGISGSRMSSAHGDLSAGSQSVNASISGSNATWTGLTEDYDFLLESTNGNYSALLVATWTKRAGSAADALTASNLTSGTPTLSTAAVGQTHAVTANALTTSVPTLGTPSLGIVDTEDNLSASSLTAAALTLGSPSIGQAHAISASALLAGTPTLGSASVGQVHSLDATGLTTTAPTLGTPALGLVDTQDELGADNLTAAEPTLGNPAIGQAHGLTATSLTAGTPEIGTPALAQGHSISAAGIDASAPTLGSGALTQAHSLTASGIAAATPTLDTATIGQTHALNAEGIETTPTLGTPGMSGEISLSANAITATPQVGTATIGQVHSLVASAIEAGAPELGSPSLETYSNTVALAATGIEATPTLGQPALSENESPVDNLSATSLAAAAPTLDLPVLGQVHALAANDNTAGAPTLGTPTLHPVSGLAAQGIEATPPTLGTPAIGQVHGLGATGIITLPAIGNAGLGQTHPLAANDIETAVPTLGQPVLFHRVTPLRHGTVGRPANDATIRPAQSFTNRPVQMNGTRPAQSNSTRPRAVSTGRR
jgi:hypothetical protein